MATDPAVPDAEHDVAARQHDARGVAVPRLEGALPAPRPDTDGDAALVARLCAGDEAAFAQIVDAWSPMLLRVARTFVSTDASAQEIVQETWLAVVKGVDKFEGRSSLRTWVFRILTNLGKTRGVREARSVPWSSLAPDESGPTVDPSRFRAGDDQYPHNWTPAGAPTAWEPSPEDSLLAGEIRGEVTRALEALPDRQRVVVSLRDVHGLSSDEVCAALDISAVNQRVLLHRGRAHLRLVLEDYYRGRGVTAP
jgi:RNA polymerase sigma-70 factor (ECF subfamily)